MAVKHRSSWRLILREPQPSYVRPKPDASALKVKEVLNRNRKQFLFVHDTPSGVSAVNDTLYLKLSYGFPCALEVSRKPANTNDWRSKVYKGEAMISAINDIFKD